MEWSFRLENGNRLSMLVSMLSIRVLVSILNELISNSEKEFVVLVNNPL